MTNCADHKVSTRDDWEDDIAFIHKMTKKKLMYQMRSHLPK